MGFKQGRDTYHTLRYLVQSPSLLLTCVAKLGVLCEQGPCVCCLFVILGPWKVWRPPAFDKQMMWCRAEQRVVEAGREGFRGCDGDLVKSWPAQALTAGSRGQRTGVKK